MHRMLSFLAVVAALSTPCVAAENGPVVVELFTSQGCSSCPPADGFLTDLARGRSDVLPLAFHVSYWDSLGWKDPFALAAANARQRAYTRTLGDDEVYTPEMVVNGVTGFVGSDRPRGLAEIAHATPQAVPVRLTRDAGGLTIDIPKGAGHADVLLVGYDHQHQTPVGRGENTGRTLTESNIVRSIASVGTWVGSPVTLHAAVPAGEAVAVLLQTDTGAIIGAVRATP